MSNFIVTLPLNIRYCLTPLRLFYNIFLFTIINDLNDFKNS